MFKAPARLYKASELLLTDSSKTVLQIMHGLELHTPKTNNLGEQYAKSLIYANPVIVRELPKPARKEGEKNEFTPAQFVCGVLSYKLMQLTNESFQVVAISEREAKDDFLCSLAWSDLFRSFVYFKTDSLAVLFKRIQTGCPVGVQKALFGGKLTQERFLQHVAISKHTLQERLKIHKPKPSIATKADAAYFGDSEHRFRSYPITC
jgi:hypothetical protein